MPLWNKGGKRSYLAEKKEADVLAAVAVAVVGTLTGHVCEVDGLAELQGWSIGECG